MSPYKISGKFAQLNTHYKIIKIDSDLSTFEFKEKKRKVTEMGFYCNTSILILIEKLCAGLFSEALLR